jgi:hypothetical protein
MDGWVWDGSNWVCDPGCPMPAMVCPPLPPMFPPAVSPPATQPAWYPGANGGVTFAQTAPPNPTRGHFWFDGITLWLFDGAAWVGVKMENVGGGNGSTPPVTVPSGPTPPFAPSPGALWFNGSVLYVWNGSAWVPTSQTKTWMQSTQPAAPLPGDTWFDGTQFHIFDGTNWVLIGPMVTAASGITQQSFALQQTTGVAIGTGWNIIPYSNTPLIDTQSGWDAITHRYTPTQAGVYFFTVRMNGAGTGGVALLKDDDGNFNGGKASDIIIGLVSSAAAGWLTLGGMTPMNGTGDFVRAWSNHGGTIPAAGSNPIFTAFKMP